MSRIRSFTVLLGQRGFRQFFTSAFCRSIGQAQSPPLLAAFLQPCIFRRMPQLSTPVVRSEILHATLND
jgi:hypothetical protein